MESRREEWLTEIADHWSESRASMAQPEHIPTFLENVRLLELTGHASNVVYQVVDIRKFKSIYVSPNVAEVCGYTPSEINSQGMVQFLRNLSLSELYFHVQNARLLQRVHKTMPPRTHFHSCLLNSGMRAKDGTRSRIISQSFTVDWDEAGRQRLHLFLWRDATHLFKSERTIMRHAWSPPTGDGTTWSYHADRDKLVEQDLLSAREREVLGHVATGASSKDIGESLGISAATVDNHRKNVLARLQVRTTDAAIEICKWLRLL